MANLSTFYPPTTALDKVLDSDIMLLRNKTLHRRNQVHDA